VVVGVTIDSLDLLFGGLDESGVYSEEECFTYWDVIPSEGRAVGREEAALNVTNQL
jgi:hypothetical protein